MAKENSPWDEARIAVENNEPEVAKGHIKRCINLYERRFLACEAGEDKNKALVMCRYTSQLLKEIETNGIKYIDADTSFPNSIARITEVQTKEDKNVYDSVCQSVVIISAKNNDITKFGTGALIGVDDKKGYIITNAHVVKGATEITAKFKDKKEFAIERIYAGYVDKNGNPPLQDLALCSFDLDDKKNSPMSIKCVKDYDNVVKEPRTVLMIGNDGGLGLAPTYGIVKYPKLKAVRYDGLLICGVYDGLLICSVLSNFGDSGAPIFITDGQHAEACIGINTGIIKAIGAERLSGLETAIPMDKVIEFIKEAKDKKGITINLNEVK